MNLHGACFVFEVLPKDLSQYILTDWLDDVADLSSLDVACTSRCWRPALLQALSGLKHFSNATNSELLHWLFGRGMFVEPQVALPLERLPFMLGALPALAKVTTIIPFKFIKKSAVSLSALEALFNNLPSLTAMNITTFQLPEECIRQLLSASSQLRLTKLMFMVPSFGPEVHSDALVQAMVLQWGGSLTDVDLTAVPALTDETLLAVTTSCVNLQRWALSCEGVEPVLTARGLLQALMACPQLTSLEIVDQQLLTDQLLSAIFSSLPNLQFIELRKAFNTSEDGWLPALFRSCPRVRQITSKAVRLDTANGRGSLLCQTSSSSSLLEFPLPVQIDVLEVGSHDDTSSQPNFHPLISRFGRNLRTLTVRKGAHDDDMIDHITSQCTALKELHLLSSKVVSPANHSLRHLAETIGQQLLTLTLWSCDALTNGDCLHILEHCKSVDTLELSWCKQLTNRTFWNVLRQLPALKYFATGYCNMEAKGIANFLVRSPRLSKPFVFNITDYRIDKEHIRRRVSEALAGSFNPWNIKQRNKQTWII